MLESVGTALTTMIGWLGSVVDAIASTTGELGALLPLFALGVAGSAIMFGVKLVRSFTWGA